MSEHKDNLVVITNGNYFARIILNDLFDRYSDNLRGVLIVTGDYKARTGFNALWSIAKTTALPYLIYKIVTLVFFRLRERVNSQSILSVERLAKSYGIPIQKVVSVNSEDAFRWIEAQKPDLLVSVSCPQLIRKKMLTLAKRGGINIHSSLLPSYAGLAPYFWVLSNGEHITGTTVHYMTPKFDEGNILVQKSLKINPGESAFSLFSRLANLGNSALVEAVDLVLQGNSGRRQDMSLYTYYSNPTYASYLKLRQQGHRLLAIPELRSKNLINHS